MKKDTTSRFCCNLMSIVGFLIVMFGIMACSNEEDDAPLPLGNQETRWVITPEAPIKFVPRGADGNYDWSDRYAVHFSIKLPKNGAEYSLKQYMVCNGHELEFYGMMLEDELHQHASDTIGVWPIGLPPYYIDYDNGAVIENDSVRFEMESRAINVSVSENTTGRNRVMWMRCLVSKGMGDTVHWIKWEQACE